MNTPFRLEDYDYELPEGQIARYPADRREESRLMVVRRDHGVEGHARFSDLPRYLRPGDCLVLNDSRVFPARLMGRKETGGRVELLMLHFPGDGRDPVVRCLARSSKPLRPGQIIEVAPELQAEVVERGEGGQVSCRLHVVGDLEEVLERYGRVPLPPYLRREDEPLDRARYQTVYAERVGSVAAPTAGLHFSGELLAALEERGVEVVKLTLHVGYGTFAPIRSEDIRKHRLHAEWMEVGQEAATRISRALQEGRRVVAVGTTVVRALESAAEEGQVRPFRGLSDLYIYPGYRFQVVGAMITNFHLPRSSLLVLVSAFAGHAAIMGAYREAVERGYRFYSYGDAMLILP